MAQERKKIKACLFDMDGLLINSEEVYTTVINEVLAENNMPLMDFKIKSKLQGLPGPVASAELLKWRPMSYTPNELFELCTERQKLLWPNVEPMPGAEELIQYLHENNIPIALGTSSHKNNFERKTGHLKHIFSKFGDHIVVGDDKRIPPGKGKPEPDIWLISLDSLNKERAASGKEKIHPSECLVFEDGIPGVHAAKSAGCQVVWIPDKRVLAEVPGEEEQILGEYGELLDSLESLDKQKYGLHVSHA